MTFSWMLYTKSKRPTICWVPAWRHLIPIPLMRHYRWNASRHHSPPKLALGLSDFSFHFNVFRNNTCIAALCDASAPSWYFDYLREVWLNKGDLVSVTFSISLWRQTGKRSQSADWTWGDRESGGCSRLFSGYGAAGLDTSLTHKPTYCLTMDYHRITPQHPVTDVYNSIAPFCKRKNQIINKTPGTAHACFIAPCKYTNTMLLM